MRHNRLITLCAGMALAALPAAGLYAAPTMQQKYDAIKAQMATMAKQMSAMQRQMAALKKKQASMAATRQTTDQKAIDRAIHRLYRKVMKQSQKISALEPGNLRVLIAGDVNFQFQHKQGSASTFYADSSPMIQVRVDKHIFINTAFDFYTNASGAGGSNADIGAANINYELNNNITLGGGLISSPIGGIVGVYNPAPWNRWVVDPSLEDNLLPPNELGVWTRGGVPVPNNLGYLTYFLFVSNGPAQTSVNSSTNSAGAYNSYTSLNFSNWDPAAQNGKAVGGRISYLPIPNIELGYSFEYARPSADGAPVTVNSLTNAVDFNAYYVNKKIDGLVRVRGGWTWDDVGQGLLVSNESGGFNNLGGMSNGGQIEFAYQPSMCGIPYVDKMMAAFRYDRIDGPASYATSGANHEVRYTCGLDYWLHSNAVLKFEYEFDNLSGGQHGNDAMFLQFAVGI